LTPAFTKASGDGPRFFGFLRTDAINATVQSEQTGQYGEAEAGAIWSDIQIAHVEGELGR